MVGVKKKRSYQQTNEYMKRSFSMNIPIIDRKKQKSKTRIDVF